MIGDVGFWEVAIIGVMALIILGPERLPKVARTAGLWIGKARSMLREVKADIKSELDASEITELKNVGKDIREAGVAFKSQVEAADQNVKSHTSEMDNAIADALNNSTETAQKKAKSKPENKPKSQSTKKSAKNTKPRSKKKDKKISDKTSSKKRANKAATKASSKKSKKA